MLIRRFGHGIENFDRATQIPDDAFVALENAVVRRGVVQKKLGNDLLGFLQYATSSNPGTTNVLGSFVGPLTADPLGGIVPGSVTITVGPSAYTDDSNGNLVNSSIVYGFVNYSTSSITLNSVASSTSIAATFSIYTARPVLGLLNLQIGSSVLGFLAFDNVMAYNYSGVSKSFYNASFYAMAAPQNPIAWTGTTSQQFDGQNFQGALFITNGNYGKPFAVLPVGATIASAGSTVTIANFPNQLVVNDILFFYEVSALAAINGLTGTVTAESPTSITVTVTGLTATLAATSTTGTLQTLTNGYTSPNAQGLSYYSVGVANAATGYYTGFTNFAPPLTLGTGANYLLGASLIIQYGNRLLMIGTWESTATGAPIYYGSRIRWSNVNNALYFQLGNPTLNTSNAWVESPLGPGGFLDLAGGANITSAEIVSETLLIGFEAFPGNSISYSKLIQTGNYISPFRDFPISVEYGCLSSFSNTVWDNSVIGLSEQGITVATPQTVTRIDERTIPDFINDVSKAGTNAAQVCSIRDYDLQLIYVTYVESDAVPTVMYPNKSLVLNHMEGCWSYFFESFTSYGYFIDQGVELTWADFGPWETLGPWSQPNPSENFVSVVGGTPCGSVMLKGSSSFMEPSMLIQNIVGQVLTIINHNLMAQQWLYITGCLGIDNLNGNNVQVMSVIDINTITISIVATGSYIGAGQAAIADNFLVTTKEYCPNWEMGVGQELKDCFFLFLTTQYGQCTASLSTNFIASPAIFSLELNTTADQQTLYANQQQQSWIWHRLFPNFTNGQTVQLSLNLSQAQMAEPLVVQSPFAMQAALINFSETGFPVC